METVQLTVPQSVLQSTGLSERELLIELAVHLYREEKLSFGKARELAGLDVVAFYRELGTREIAIHYDDEELAQDLEAIKQMSRR